jgi:hypothetical protein
MRLLRGLGGRVLSCGCLIGIYETYEGQVVATIDAPGAACGDAAHRLHHTLPIEVIEPPGVADERPSHPQPRA